MADISKCLKTVRALDEADIDDVLDALDGYIREGVAPEQAQRLAVQDALNNANRDFNELDDMIRRQNPDAFDEPDTLTVKTNEINSLLQEASLKDLGATNDEINEIFNAHQSSEAETPNSQRDDSTTGQRLEEPSGQSQQEGSVEERSGDRPRGESVNRQSDSDTVRSEPEREPEPILESQTKADLEAKDKQANAPESDKAVADREAEVPFTLQKQSAPEKADTTGEIFTPDGRASEAAKGKQQKSKAQVDAELALNKIDDLNLNPDTTKPQVRNFAKKLLANGVIDESDYKNIDNILKDRDMSFEDALDDLKVTLEVSLDGFKNKNTGIQFYSGFPIDKAYDTIKQALESVFSSKYVQKNLDEWRDRKQAFKAAEDADKKANATNDGGLKRGLKSVADGFNSLITGQVAIMEGMAKKANSKTIAEIAELFSDRVGTGDANRTGKSYYHEIEQGFTQRLNRVADSIGEKYINDPKFWADVVAQVKNRNSINTDRRSGIAAREIAKILDEEIAALKATGLDIGEQKNYFPDRELNVEQVFANQANFLLAQTRAYVINGSSPVEARALADARLKAILLGEDGATGSPFVANQSGSPDTSFTKSRVLSDKAAQALRDAGFYYDNPLESLTTYLYRSARKVAYEKRFGGKTEDGQSNAKWKAIENKLLEEGNGQYIDDIKRQMVSLLGEMPSYSVGKLGRRTASFLQTANVITYLSGLGTTLTSLPEPLIGAARTGRLENVPKALYITARNVGASLAQSAGLKGNWAKSLSKEEAYAAAEMIGSLSHTLLNDSMLHNRLGGNMTNKSASLAVNTALKWNGLLGLTRAQRSAMVELGANFVNVLAKEVTTGKGGKLTTLSLNELGIPEAKHKEFANWLQAQEKGEYGGVKVENLKNNDAMMTLYKDALYRFNSQSIMNPNRGQMPRLASHPVGKVAYGLLSYTYGFTDAVLKRSGRLLKESVTGEGYTAQERARLATPALVAGLVVPLIQYALMPFRDALSGASDEQKEKREQDTVFGIRGDKFEAIQRSGVLGKFDPLVNLVTGLRYSRDLSNVFLGASGGGLASTAQTGINLAGDKNSDETNTAERAFTRNLWATVVEPTMVYYGIKTLPSVVGIPAQMIVKNKRTRDAAVDAIAGEREAE